MVLLYFIIIQCKIIKVSSQTEIVKFKLHEINSKFSLSNSTLSAGTVYFLENIGCCTWEEYYTCIESTEQRQKCIAWQFRPWYLSNQQNPTNHFTKSCVNKYSFMLSIKQNLKTSYFELLNCNLFNVRRLAQFLL